MKSVIIGIDLGGTNLRIGAVTPDNEMIAPSVIKSSVVAHAERPIEKICEIIAEYKKENGIENVEAISIGVPSSVENDKETVICTTNIRNQNGEAVFSHMNVAGGIREYFKIPVYINNDVNNIMLYDIVVNHLEDKKVVVGIYIGTGVGASVVLDGRLLEGKNGAELDLGHIPYFGGDITCSCGKKGCCECYASGWRLQELRKEYYPDTRIQDMFTRHKEDKPMVEFIRACANVYAVMATIFNPDTIIVGGGIPEMADFPRETFEEAVNQNTGRDVMAYGFDYVYSREFVGKGVIGAAIFARKRLALHPQ
ncbi:allose kinase [Extibacter muris]|uniref:allose kinase n=1 Tax=Extibacter muris TaxID=1796622 RepID=UPI001D0705E1|nr:allose kinase [Extibacter muris]MCB6200877.1 allose kinase [Extibacter muris]MCQ4662207.1 allose kinase [Extibacter muris]MCQ4691879.1 allose kinase [Extibacter muris]